MLGLQRKIQARPGKRDQFIEAAELLLGVRDDLRGGLAVVGRRGLA